MGLLRLVVPRLFASNHSILHLARFLYPLTRLVSLLPV